MREATIGLIIEIRPGMHGSWVGTGGILVEPVHGQRHGHAEAKLLRYSERDDSTVIVDRDPVLLAIKWSDSICIFLCRQIRQRHLPKSPEGSSRQVEYGQDQFQSCGRTATLGNARVHRVRTTRNSAFPLIIRA